MDASVCRAHVRTSERSSPQSRRSWHAMEHHSSWAVTGSSTHSVAYRGAGASAEPFSRSSSSSAPSSPRSISRSEALEKRAVLLSSPVSANASSDRWLSRALGSISMYSTT
eukprot:scaffold186388_cov29-Tisochrysis_lutea.AAC.3